MARNRFQWVEMARLGIVSALGDDVVSARFMVYPTVDPLRFILKITLHMPLVKGTRAPLRSYLRAWASEFSCDITTIDIQPRYIQAEVLTQSRVWSRDAKSGRFKQNQRFERKRPREEETDET